MNTNNIDIVREQVRNAVPSVSIPPHYSLSEAGLFFIKEGKGDEEPEHIWLGDVIRIIGETRDIASEAWGLLLEWRDREGVLHRWAMPRRWLAQDGSAWLEVLADAGWAVNLGQKSKLKGFFSAVTTSRLVRCVGKVGWYNSCYVLPNAVYGNSGAEEVVLQTGAPVASYKVGGTLEGARELARLTVGNSRLMLAYCAALAGPLLTLAEMDSFVLHLYGDSSCGKSTALHLAGSVWDCYTKKDLPTWRVTDNGLEGRLAVSNDGLILLDEMGQAPAKAVREVAYLVGNGQGKARAKIDGTLRSPSTWSVVGLSSGEITLAAKLHEIDESPMAGQEVRFLDIPADPDAGYGLFETLKGRESPLVLATDIFEMATTHYGLAGRTFLDYLTANFSTIRDNIKPFIDETAKQIAPIGSGGQVLRVTRRFALLVFAGTMAINAGILPAEFSDVLKAIQSCFDAWVGERDFDKAREDKQILEKLQLFFEQHGRSRFQEHTMPEIPIQRMCGYRSDGDEEYWCFPQSFKHEICDKWPHTRVVKVLRKRDLMAFDRPRNLTARRTPRGKNRQEFFVVRYFPSDEND